MTMSRRSRVLVGAAGVALGAAMLAVLVTGSERESGLDAAAEVITGESFIVAGLVVSARRPSNRAGLLMVAVGFAWLIRDIRYVETSLTYTLGTFAEGFQWLILGHLIATYPTGRAQDRFERFTVVLIYLFAVPNAFGTLPFDEARDCGDCLTNLLSIHPDPALATAVRTTLVVCSIFITPLVLVCFLRRWHRASPSGRRMFTPVCVGVLILFGVVMVGVVSVGALEELPHWIMQLAFLSLSGGLLVGLLRGWLDRQALSKLMLELGRASTPDRLRRLLAQSLHDPTVELLFWDDDKQSYVDAEGRQRELPASSMQRAVTRLGPEDRRVGALLHDPRLLDDPVLVHAVGEAARFALDNERLQAEVRVQLEEVRASRARIIDAADAERRRVERDLHDGAQQRLVTLSLALGLAREQAASNRDGALRASLAEASEEAARALNELRELGRGLHPTILAEAGLGPALESLAEGSTVPATLAVGPTERLPEAVEIGAYFVASEALANVTKHADASHVTLRAQRQNGVLVLEVADDGCGGADPARGSGLTGLEDRVAALGGRLSVESPSDAGTRIVAEIPCA
jgi:signal transduction histidine kinase